MRRVRGRGHARNTRLRSRAVIMFHEKSGARLLHLCNDDPNNLFSIAFDPVFNNTGAPHILEHSVLGGSRKFPARGSFQELLKGSLQTFLNALTYPDKTMYPVSSQVEADFFNLVDVYCDAVFHPLLTKNTFYQEGWHFDVENMNGPVNIKGIVYNEMKGVFSNFASHVELKTISQLFPDISYRYESGGVPENITDLSYEQFKEFHASFYHPSNSFIFLYGNIPTQKILKFLHENYLGEFDRATVDSEIAAQPLWSAPRTTEIEAPAPAEEDGTATVALSWIRYGQKPGGVAHRKRVLPLFAGDQSSPLKRALIDARLGEAERQYGVGQRLRAKRLQRRAEKDKTRACSRHRKTRPRHPEKRNRLRTRRRAFEGALRQIEFRLREISDAGRFPYSLVLAERCLEAGSMAEIRGLSGVREKHRGPARHEKGWRSSLSLPSCAGGFLTITTACSPWSRPPPKWANAWKMRKPRTMPRS